jgi:alpha-L-rhamnosidase
VLGGRVIFRVLCDFGYEDLAIKMITRPDQPSYGCMIADGLTTLGETPRPPYSSLNHHFWGDISALMIEYFAGIRVNRDLLGADHIDIAPVFASDMDHAEGYHNSVCGKVDVKWQKKADCIELTLTYPEGAVGCVNAPAGYTVNGAAKVSAASGSYIFKKI